MQISTIIVLCVVGYFVIGAGLGVSHLLRADLDPNKDAFEKATGYLLLWLPIAIGVTAYCFAVWAAGLANRVRILGEEQASVTTTQKGVV
jgi:hypothetical protein